MTYTVVEGTLSPIAIGYYLINRKKLKDKKCLARVLLTRGKSDSLASNIIEAINFILTSNIRIRRNDEDKHVKPFSEVQEGDVIHYSMCMFHEFWKYDGKKLIYDEEQSC